MADRKITSRIISNAYLIFITETFGQDPCGSSVSRFTESGCRNPDHTNLSHICDFFVEAGWYVASDSLLVDRCTQGRGCGVDYPTWLNGTYS